MNLRPPGYEPDELPSCSTPRHSVAFIGDIDYYTLFQQFCQEGAESFFAAEAEDENAAADLLSRKPAATPIHAPPRGATKRGVGNEAPARFQFTPLREGRPDGMLRRAGWAHFNSRPSARGDASCTLQIVSLTRFQFTPLREGRLSRYTFDNDLPDISIHAPPRGATMLSEQQHPLSWHFNSRPSARGDGNMRNVLDIYTISIHAPPRGATLQAALRIGRNGKFQFTPLREGRLKKSQKNAKKGLFQFTPLREGRRQHPPSCPTRTYFNSRPSARGDLHKKTLRMDGDISIHAPPRGATGCWRYPLHAASISIHAPPRGATADVPQLPSKRLISIHAPPRGATGQRCFLKLESLFQFTPLREGRPHIQRQATDGHYFNSRPSARGDADTRASCLGDSLFQFTPLREGRRRWALP